MLHVATLLWQTGRAACFGQQGTGLSSSTVRVPLTVDAGGLVERGAHVLRYEAPFTSRMAPVIEGGASSARKRTTVATSSAVVTCPSG